jgi:hypothetical protein
LRRLTWLLTCVVVAAVAVGLRSPAVAGDDPSPRPGPGSRGAEPTAGDAPPAYIFLNAPGDLDAFWKKLTQPDFILMTGEDFRNKLARARAESAPAGPWAVVPRSVAIRGEVQAELASLSLELGVSVLVAEPTWVSVRLDKQTVTEAREGDRPLPIRVGPQGDWQAEVHGRGEHAIRVDFEARPRTTIAGRDLGFAIPAAPSTEVKVDVDQVVAEASAGSDEPVRREPIRGGKATRLSAHLVPRARLDLGWQVEADSGAQLAPLLTIQGDIAIDVDPGAFRTRSSWIIKSIRGAMRSLELRIDPDDEVLELTLDGQSMPAGIERVGGATRLTIPLTEPLRPGQTRRLVMATQRKLPPLASARLTFNGFSLSNAKEQSGAIGIAQSGNLWISGTQGRGLRQIDPRTELPADLRARPATFLAYKFVDQPFDLNLRIEPSPPLVRSDTRTTVALESAEARVDTWIATESAHGRLFDLNVLVPHGLEVESVGPGDVVESWQVSAERDGVRTLTARLTFRAQESGAFSLHLSGRQPIDPSGPVRLALFQPQESSLGGGRLAVLTDRNLTVDLLDRDDGEPGPELFRPARQDPPADWPWPPGRAETDSPALWLRYDGNPAALPLRVVLHPRSVSHDTNLVLQVGRRGVEGRQDNELSVHFGTLDQIDIEVPPELVGRWELEDGEIASRVDLGATSAGGRRFRLKFADEVTERTRLNFRFRRPLAAELEPQKGTEVEVPWIRIQGSSSGPLHARVASDSGIRVDLRPPGWVHVAGEEAGASDGGPPVRLRLVSSLPESDTPPLRLTATALALTPLPSLVASRLWLRTVQGPEYELRSSAWFWIESHESTVSVALPPGAEWLRARVGGETVGQVEQLPDASGYRFRMPSRVGTGPVLLALDYIVRSPEAGSAWDAPRLLSGVVQQTLWEVRVPRIRALVGVPPGWTDENQWYWAGYVWKRRPWRSSGELAAWAGGASSRGKPAEGGGIELPEDYHSYLFGRPGPPTELRVRIASRAGLVAICSGPVLALGVWLIVSRRSRFRLVWPVLVAVALLVGAAVQPSVTFLAIQSGMVGVIFTLLAALMQRLVDRPRRRGAPGFGDASSLTSRPGSAPGSSVNRAGGVGSDDSTAIRIRPVSTVDHLPTGSPGGPESIAGRPLPRERNP